MNFKHFKTALRFAVIGLLIGSLPFFWLVILAGADFIEGYVAVVVAADVFGLASCGWKSCPDFGGLIHIITAPISWALYLFFIGFVKSIRAQNYIESMKEKKWRRLSLIIAAILHIVVTSIVDVYATRSFSNDLLSISAQYGQLFIAASLLIWLASEFSRARIFYLGSIALLIFALLSPIHTIRSISEVGRSIEEFDIKTNAQLGLTDQQRAYENCGKIREILRTDPSAVRTHTEVSVFEHACYRELAVVTRDYKLCHPLSKTFPGDLAGCMYSISAKNRDSSLCYQYENIAVDFEAKLKTENKWPYTDNNPRFKLSECLRIVSEQEWYYIQ